MVQEGHISVSLFDVVGTRDRWGPPKKLCHDERRHKSPDERLVVRFPETYEPGARAAGMAAERARVSESGAGVTSVTTSFVGGEQDLRRRNRSEKHQNFSEGVPAGQVRDKCRITSCEFISFSCTEDLHPERFSRDNIRSESERAGGRSIPTRNRGFTMKRCERSARPPVGCSALEPFGPTSSTSRCRPG